MHSLRHTAGVHRLSARDLRRSRPHLTAVRSVWTALVMGWLIVGIESTPTYFERAPLWSGEYVADGLVATVLAGGLLVWAVPRVTLGVTAVLGVVGGLLDPVTSHLWWWIGAAAAALLMFLLVRDARSRPRGDVVVPSTDVPFDRSWAAPAPHHGWLGWGGIAFAAAAGVAALIVHQVQAADVAAFEARASRVTVPLSGIEVRDDLTYLTVTIDGVDHEFDDPWYDENLAVGTAVEVLVDDDGRAVLAGAGQDDPSWLLGVAAALPLAGVAAWGRLLAPARRRRRLVQRGAPGTTVRVVCNGDLALVLPVDADWPALELTGLDGHTDRGPVVREAEAREAEFEEWGDDADEEPERPLPGTVAEVAAWADGLRAEVEREEPEVLTSQEKVIAEAVVGPDTNGAEPFILVGSWASGNSVALARATGQVWLAEVTEPKPFQGRRRFLKAVRPELPGWKGDDVAALSWRGRATLWAVANGRWTRWAAAGAVAVLGALGVPLLFAEAWDGGDWLGDARLVLTALAVVTGPFWATSWSVYEFARLSQGFGLYGLLLDDVIARDRVEMIAPGRDAIGIRLREPEDILSLDPEVVRPGATPESAAAELRRWLDAAPARARSGRRPTPAVVATALMLASWAVQMVG